jgi:hypothetical protein
MEDIINAIRRVNTVEMKEEIEYHWDLIEPKSKQKYHRFFFITCKI